MGLLDSLKGMFGGNKDKSANGAEGLSQPGSSVPPAGDINTGAGSMPSPSSTPASDPAPDASPTPPAGAGTADPQNPTAPGAGSDPTKPAQ